MRIVTLVRRPDADEPRLDADVAVGGEDGPGEVAVLRLRGALAEHANSVAIPLLLSDTPVVAYWPGSCPPVPFDDPIGRHAQRRITDLRAEGNPVDGLQKRRDGYRPGDTDLAWTRVTPWRSALAALLDANTEPVSAVAITASPGNPSALLLSSWLSRALKVPAPISDSRGPGLTEVRLTQASGDLVVSRADGTHGLISRPGAPDSPVALKRRDLADLLSEELRRMDPDEVYGKVLQHTGQAKG
jgi:glucose-6-phosphate dehydrogenase assembly protein OpcA